MNNFLTLYLLLVLSFSFLSLAVWIISATWHLPRDAVVKNLPAMAGDTRDAVSILGLGRFPGEGNGNTTLVMLPGKIPWTEKPGRLYSMRLHRVEHG